MKPDESGLQRPTSQFVCITCGDAPRVLVVSGVITLKCARCKVEETYGSRHGAISAGDPESQQ